MDNPLDQLLCTLRFDFHVIFVGFKMAEKPRPDIDDSPTKQTRPVFFFLVISVWWNFNKRSKNSPNSNRKF